MAGGNSFVFFALGTAMAFAGSSGAALGPRPLENDVKAIEVKVKGGSYSLSHRAGYIDK